MCDNALDREWSGMQLLRFALPTVVMMVSMGLYTVVDTVFVARLVNTDALSAVNIVCPVVNVVVGLGTMLASGGNAVISREMGAGREREAKEDFTLLVLAAAAIGVALAVAGSVWLDEIVRALGASERLFSYGRDYLGVLVLFAPVNMVQTVFSNLFVAAGRPGMGLGLALAAGLSNILLDGVFMAVCGLGVRGAALGTGCGYLIPAAVGAAFFARSRGTLAFTGPRWKGRMLRESCLNGASELVSQLAAAVTTFLFNGTMLDLAGEDGVAAVTIMIYTQFLLSALYIGFSMGVAPILAFQCGSGNRRRQRRVLKSCVGFIAVASLAVFAVSRLGGARIAGAFAPAGSAVYELAAEGFPVFSYGFLFCGFNIFTSALFTALSNGKVSAALSFFRTFGLLAGGLLVLPRIWGLAGVWLAVPAAEGIVCLASSLCLACYVRRRLRR